MSWKTKKHWSELRFVRYIRSLVPDQRVVWWMYKMKNVKDREETIWAEMLRHEADWYRNPFQNSTKLYNITKGE